MHWSNQFSMVSQGESFCPSLMRTIDVMGYSFYWLLSSQKEQHCIWTFFVFADKHIMCYIMITIICIMQECECYVHVMQLGDKSRWATKIAVRHHCIIYKLILRCFVTSWWLSPYINILIASSRYYKIASHTFMSLKGCYVSYIVQVFCWNSMFYPFLNLFL